MEIDEDILKQLAKSLKCSRAVFYAFGTSWLTVVLSERKGDLVDALLDNRAISTVKGILSKGNLVEHRLMKLFQA